MQRCNLRKQRLRTRLLATGSEPPTNRVHTRPQPNAPAQPVSTAAVHQSCARIPCRCSFTRPNDTRSQHDINSFSYSNCITFTTRANADPTTADGIASNRRHRLDRKATYPRTLHHKDLRARASQRIHGPTTNISVRSSRTEHFIFQHTLMSDDCAATQPQTCTRTLGRQDSASRVAAYHNHLLLSNEEHSVVSEFARRWIWAGDTWGRCVYVAGGP